MKWANQVKRATCPKDCKAADVPCGCGYLPRLPCAHPVWRHQQVEKTEDEQQQVSAEDAHPAEPGQPTLFDLTDPAMAVVA